MTLSHVMSDELSDLSVPTHVVITLVGESPAHLNQCPCSSQPRIIQLPLQPAPHQSSTSTTHHKPSSAAIRRQCPSSPVSSICSQQQPSPATDHLASSSYLCSQHRTKPIISNTSALSNCHLQGCHQACPPPK